MPKQELDQQALQQLLGAVNEVLEKADLTGVSAEGTGLSELPDGYYLSEIESAELQFSKNSGKPQAKLTLKVVEDGIGIKVEEEEAKHFDIPKTKGRTIFLYYPLKNDDDGVSVKRFASDMMKFEGDKEGEPALPKEAWTRADVLVDALDLIASMKLRIYVSISTSSKTVDGVEVASTWKNLISWKRAKGLELPQ